MKKQNRSTSYGASGGNGLTEKGQLLNYRVRRIPPQLLTQVTSFFPSNPLHQIPGVVRYSAIGKSHKAIAFYRNMSSSKMIR
jgi:hypothetical protein